MVSIDTVRTLALSFPGTTEEPHFDKTSFRVKKKIFATCDETNKTACVKLSPIDQDVFTLTNPAMMYPATGKWGLQGWTLIDLRKIRKVVLIDALTTAYNTVAKPIKPKG
jgi:predicted DNA-binding protein (MmcQ/YjbR family)